MTYTYNIKEWEAFRPAQKDFVTTYKVECIRTSEAGWHNREVIAVYNTRAAAELVISALRAAQNDLT